MMPLRISVITSGRFWLLDLARELALLGHEVSFYSCVSRARAQKFGLPPRAWKPMPIFCTLTYALSQRVRQGLLSAGLVNILQRQFQRSVIQKVGYSDVLISLSGFAPRANALLKSRLKSRLWIERGSRHYLSQMRILAAMPSARVQRLPSPLGELSDYANADRIVVPAAHVVHSFLEEGIPATKLFCNPYGVDLRMFAPTPAPPAGSPPTIVMVGRWSYRKGCDLLTSAWRTMPGVRLCHIGPVDDYPLPTEPGFSHTDSVDQAALRTHYAQGHVFALASREEGLALVQAQALACGLRLVCTDRTGGEDLRQFLPDQEAIIVVPSDDVAALRGALHQSLSLALAEPQGMRNRLGAAAESLSWRAYGLRYSTVLQSEPSLPAPESA